MAPASTSVTLTTADGEQLDGDMAEVAEPWASVVLCHPHPLYGGNRQAGLIGHLFSALPEAGIRTLRFDFRGVGRSTGTHDDGRAEQADVAAAIDHIAENHATGPVATVGWSFGGDVSLATDYDAIERRCAIAAPLAVIEPEEMAAATDDRPTLLLVPEHDEFRSPSNARETVAAWPTTTVETIGGASHLVIGRYEATTEMIVEFLRQPPA
jgi:alpha/beta superfamily hydrolase